MNAKGNWNALQFLFASIRVHSRENPSYSTCPRPNHIQFSAAAIKIGKTANGHE